MSDSLFGDYDIAGAADDPFDLPDGTFEGVISNIKVLSGNNDNGEYKGFVPVLTTEKGSHEHYFGLPVEGTSPEVAERMRSSLKHFLAGLEVPEDKMNTTKPEDLIGEPVVFTLSSRKGKNGRTYRNIEISLKKGTPISQPKVKQNTAIPGISDEDFGL